MAGLKDIMVLPGECATHNALDKIQKNLEI